MLKSQPEGLHDANQKYEEACIEGCQFSRASHGKAFGSHLSKDQQQNCHAGNGNRFGMLDLKGFENGEPEGGRGHVDDRIANENGGEQTRWMIQHLFNACCGFYVAFANAANQDRIQREQAGL